MIKLLTLLLLANLSFANGCGTWEHTENAAISGFNDVHLSGISVQGCKAECCHDPQCKSFDYYKNRDRCDLSYSNARDVGGLKTDYAGHPYDHYHLNRFTNACNQDKIQRNVDYWGSDLRWIDQVEDAEGCGKLCAQTPSCKSWTYIKDPTHRDCKRCYLKSSDSITATSNTCCDSGLQDACSDSCVILHGQDIVDGTFVPCCGHGMTVGSDEECRTVCASQSECTAWVTTSPEGSSTITCYMTSGPVSWEADSARNGGLPCTPSDNSEVSSLSCSYKPLGGLAMDEGNLLIWQTGTLDNAKMNCGEWDTCQSFAFCGGGSSAGVRDYYLYDKRMSSDEPLSLRTDCTTYSKVCLAKPVKSIGYWTFTAENRHADDQEITITKTFSGSKSAEEAETELQSISNSIKQSHSAEVAVGLSVGFKKIAEASLETKYGYEYEHNHAEEFDSSLALTATETYEQGLSFERKMTIPARKLHEPTHVNIWVWKTEAIREDSTSQLAGSSNVYNGPFLMRSGCGYDIPPNCLPGKCDPHDKDCWTCTDDKWKIDPDFEPPTYCDEEECSFIAIRTVDCPNRLRMRELENCRTTGDMKEGELCEATNNIPGFIEEHDINNCPGGRDIFRYSCALTASEECDFKETFTATGCPNNEIPLTIMQDWNDENKFSSYDLVLKNMLSYCNDVKNGIATDAQKQVCCGGVDCQAGLRCVEQPEMILCSRKSHCTVREDIDYSGSDIRIILQVADADDCAKLCSQESLCASWTYVKDFTHEGFRNCHLKSRDDITATSNTCCDSGLRNACSSVSSTTTPTNQGALI